MLVGVTTIATVGVAPAASGSAVSAGVSAAAQPTSTKSCERIVDFDRDDFPSRPRIDNRFFPLEPGTQYVLEGRANRGGGPLPHTVIFTVTDLVKEVNGVRSLVLWDVDINEGKLSEAELAFFAQDKRGNVWSLGEYPEEYDKGKFVGAPSIWISGRERAEAGVMMLAHPRLGTPTYLQGSAPAVDFLDCARVFATDQRVCVPADCYHDVLVTDEHSPLDPAGGHQRKFYAPGVGNVQVTAVDDPEGETLVLTKVRRLDRKELAEARKEALRLERRAYKISDVYRHTRPARRL